MVVVVAAAAVTAAVVVVAAAAAVTVTVAAVTVTTAAAAVVVVVMMMMMMMMMMIRDDGSSGLCSDEKVDVSFSACICETKLDLILLLLPILTHCNALSLAVAVLLLRTGKISHMAIHHSLRFVLLTVPSIVLLPYRFYVQGSALALHLLKPRRDTCAIQTDGHCKTFRKEPCILQ